MPETIEVALLRSQFLEWVKAMTNTRINAVTGFQYAELTGRIELCEWLDRMLDAYAAQEDKDAEDGDAAGDQGAEAAPEGSGGYEDPTEGIAPGHP